MNNFFYRGRKWCSRSAACNKKHGLPTFVPVIRGFHDLIFPPLALSKSGYGSKYSFLSAGCFQLPVCSFTAVPLYHDSKFCQLFSEPTEIRAVAGPDCEVGVKRYAYCRRNPLFALTFQKRSNEMVCDDCASDVFGIKIVRFFGRIRCGSNIIIHCRLPFSLIVD